MIIVFTVTTITHGLLFGKLRIHMIFEYFMKKISEEYGKFSTILYLQAFQILIFDEFHFFYIKQNVLKDELMILLYKRKRSINKAFNKKIVKNPYYTTSN